MRPLSIVLLGLAACAPASRADDGLDGGADAAPARDFADAAPCEESVPITVEVTREPPDLLLVLDRSGSMNDEIGGTEKWGIMSGALSAVLNQRQADIKFGLAMFPSDGDCGGDEIHEPVALNNAGGITSWLSSTNVKGDTPTHKALAHAGLFYTAIPENPAGRYVLLATDGLPNCGDDDGDDSTQAIQELRADGIETYVIGFGDVSEANPGLLNQWASAGGTNQFYPATSPQQLDQALADISQEVTRPSCTVELPSPLDDPDGVSVALDGEPVPRDPDDGWDYNPASATIEFYGAFCERIRSGDVEQVDLDLGCAIVK